MRVHLAAVAAALLLLCFPGRPCDAEDSPASGAGTPSAIVLDTGSFWRMHHALGMPVIRFDDGLREIPPAGREADVWKAVVAKPTPDAPQGWMDPDFDDSTWYRAPAAAGCRTPYVRRLCARGKFTVTDPGKVSGLSLSLDYHGGAVVFVNGKELARGHVAAGDAAKEILADDYPEDVFLDEDGKLLSVRGNAPLLDKEAVSEESLRRIARRTRTLNVPISGEHLRKGLNVIGIELVRAPYHKVLEAHKVTQQYKSKDMTNDMSWNTCELRRVRLAASSAAGLVPDAVRPQGVQVWNSDPLVTDFDLDFGIRAEPLRPIRLVGARNGGYSGKVVVGSTAPIRGLRAVAGDLAGPGGDTMPASCVCVRYALPWGVCRTTSKGNLETTPYPAETTPLFALAESPLEEFPVREKTLGGPTGGLPNVRSVLRYSLEPFHLNDPGQPAPVFGAVVPVWVTVRIPKDARAGTYAGTVSLQVDGKAVAGVPVEVKVVDWTLPDPDDYRTWVELIQSPDTLALEYGVEPWSDGHFELIANSMKYLKEIGSRILYVPLIAHTNLGNEESMVRWVPKGDDRYEHDFSVMDRYLDVAEAHMGKPKIVVFAVWDLYLYRAGGVAYASVGSRTRQQASKRAGEGPQVTMVDPDSGKAEVGRLPPYLDPSSKALWKPLFDQLRERMKKRGLEKAMMLGTITDAWASKEQVQFFQDVGADFPWVSSSHGRHDKPKAMYELADVGYQAHAFGVECGFAESLRGWSRPTLNALYERWGGFPATGISRWRHFGEYSITGNTRGIGRVGADFWQAVKDSQGRRKGHVSQRYPESSWRQLTLITSALAPGPDRAVATAKYEAMREGVQECEARILIEEALSDKAMAETLGPDLVGRCRDVLDERHRSMWLSVSTLQVGPLPEHAFAGWRGCAFTGVTGYKWFLGSGWQERSEKLYATAGDVAKKLDAQ